jgi:cation diffusion facilitator CzcD-associated flavoprotein CzcO
MLVSLATVEITGKCHVRTYVLTEYRLEDKTPHPNLTDFSALASRKGDAPIEIPPQLPARTPKHERPRYAESSVYPYLETNVHSVAMSFSQEKIPSIKSKLSVSKHGKDTPFVHHSVIQKYVDSLVHRNGYEKIISYNTTVERAEKVGDEWRLTLRQESGNEDIWWEERFDALVVASGHYNVPYIPIINGLAEFEKQYPGSVKHSKMFRGRDAYRGKVSPIPLCR